MLPLWPTSVPQSLRWGTGCCGQVQLLDRSHVLVKLGSAAEGVPLPPRSSESSSSHSFFFAVYNLHTTEMVSFFLVRSWTLYGEGFLLLSAPCFSAKARCWGKASWFQG